MKHSRYNSCNNVSIEFEGGKQHDKIQSKRTTGSLNPSKPDSESTRMHEDLYERNIAHKCDDTASHIHTVGDLFIQFRTSLLTHRVMKFHELCRSNEARSQRCLGVVAVPSPWVQFSGPDRLLIHQLHNDSIDQFPRADIRSET